MERVVAPAWDQMVYLVSPILIFMSSSFSPTLQNNNYFLLLLNILMQTDLPFTDQVLSLLQTHRMAGMSLFLFSLLCHELHMEAADTKPLPRKQIIPHNFW